MECLGTFKATYFKFLSGDPNSMFQFFVYPEQVIMLKVGSALNQLPAMLLSHGASRLALGVKDHAVQGLPSLEQARALIGEGSKKATLGIKSSAMPSREIPIRNIRRVENTKFVFIHPSVLQRNSMRIHLTSGEVLPFVIPKPEDAPPIGRLLRPLLGNRYTEQRQK